MTREDGSDDRRGIGRRTVLRLSALAGGLGLGGSGWVSASGGGSGVQQRPNVTGFHAPTITGIPYGHSGQELPGGTAGEWADASRRSGELVSGGGDLRLGATAYLKGVGSNVFVGLQVPAEEREQFPGVSARGLRRVRLYLDRTGSGELSEGDARLVGLPDRSPGEDVQDPADGIRSMGWELEVLRNGQFVALDEVEPNLSPASLMARDLADGSLGVEGRIDRREIEQAIEGAFDGDDGEADLNINLDAVLGDAQFGLNYDPNQFPSKYELGGTYTPVDFSRFPREDSSVNRIEVTQSVQDERNRLPLVRGKETLARVFVDHPESSAIEVDVTLEALASTDGSPHWQSIGTLSKRATVSPTPHARDEWDDSVNFELPASWRSEDALFLKARTSRPDHIDYGLENRAGYAFVSLGDTYDPRIFVGRVDGPNGRPTNSSKALLQDAFERLMPLDRVRWFWFTSPLIRNVSGSDNLISRIDRIARYLQTTKWAPVDQAFGLCVNYPGGGGLSSPSWSGGTSNHLAAWGDDLSGRFVSSSWEHIMAHEINHNIGGKTWAMHLGGNCGSDGADSNRSSWRTGEVGWSPAYDRMIPNDHPELMSYCNTNTGSISFSGPNRPRQWVSDYRWTRLYSRFRNWVPGKPRDPDYGGPTPALADVESGPSVPAAQADGGTTSQQSTARVVSGFLYPDGTGDLHPSFEFPGATQFPEETTEEPTAYLEVDYGQETRRLGIEPSFEAVEQETVEEASFSFALPDEGSIQAVRLVDADTGEALDGYEPTGFEIQEAGVAVPNGFARGEEYQLDVVVDAQSESTLYKQLLYSPDGEGWIPYSEIFAEGSPVVEFSDVPGGAAARFLLLVGDGVRTRMFESETFVVEPLPPEVEITRANRLVFDTDENAAVEDRDGGPGGPAGAGENEAQAGEIVNVAGPVQTVVGATVSLQAHGRSQQWQPLDPQLLEWSIQGPQGQSVQPLGSAVGERFLHRFERPGTYTVEVTGTDPATELSATDSIEVEVSPPPLPDAETVEAFLDRRDDLGSATPTDEPAETTSPSETEPPSSPEETRTETSADQTETSPPETDGTPDDDTPAEEVTTPGFGLGGAVAALGAAGYALKRRLLDDDEE